MVNYQQKKPKHSITAGADPEFFLRSGKVFIPSTKIIGGTKKSPIPIPGLPDGFSMQEDNIMGEFNIPPCKDAKTFSHSIGIALKSISELIPSNTEIVIQPSAVFKPKFTKTRAAKVFGCDPDINAWTESPNRFMPAEDPILHVTMLFVQWMCSWGFHQSLWIRIQNAVKCMVRQDHSVKNHTVWSIEHYQTSGFKQRH
jgi:hypothetical protein